MTTYIHERADWPNFRWDAERLASRLAQVRWRQGKFAGRMEALGFKLQEEAVLATLTEDVVKSSEIEGEALERDQVRSSIARRMGMDAGGLIPSSRDVDGVVEMLVDATQNFDKPLTASRLYGWHAALFPTGRSGLHKIRVGKWRSDGSGPMQVVSGAIGRQKIHYEAPPADRIPMQMAAFIESFGKKDATDPVLRAGLAHLWFVTIHPFDDGNGRIARAIADLALARSEMSAQRFYSMSSQIRSERSTYYKLLEQTQRGDMDVTAWLEWFLLCLDRALGGAEDILRSTLTKASFWERHGSTRLNERQRKVLDRLLDGFEGKLTSSKWAALTKSSQDTALRDIADLVERGLLAKDSAGGRSTSYSLVNDG